MRTGPVQTWTYYGFWSSMLTILLTAATCRVKPHFGPEVEETGHPLDRDGNAVARSGFCQSRVYRYV